jgi:hypothetical protein
LDSDLSSERWRPYRNWLSELNNDDTIITFNYDPVLEKLSGEYRRLRVLIPGSDCKRSTRETGETDVLKLHGSVNWRRDGKTIHNEADLEFGAKCHEGDLAIATPGASKHLDVNDLFMPLWNLADQAVKEADAIVFVGYRFPPSDAYSRERLLRALWMNPSQDLVVSVVLGPNVQHEDIVRLEKMLDWTIASCPVEKRPEDRRITFPLFAEDYLTIWKLDTHTHALSGEPGDKV